MSEVLFLLSAVVIVASARRLAHYGDMIAVRTRLGGMFVGTLLLALATSLPELLTMIASVGQALPSMAAGSIFGSCMFNMCLLGLLDTAHRRVRLLRSVALAHATSGALAVLMLAATVLFILADLPLRIGWVGLDSLMLIALYLGGVFLLRGSDPMPAAPAAEEPALIGVPSLRHGLLGFLAASLVLSLATPVMVASAGNLADQTGLSAGFMGTAAVAIVTSLPEAATTISAIRIRAFDMAVGNLFGSNIFNIFALGLTDLIVLDGRFLAGIDPDMTLAALLALVLTAVGLLGNVARIERRLGFVELDAAFIMLIYLAGMWLLYTRGIAVG